MRRRNFIATVSIFMVPPYLSAEATKPDEFSSSRKLAKEFLWRKKINDKDVEIKLTSGDYIPKISDGDWVVDEYPTPRGLGAAGSKTHLQSCSVKWGKLELPIPQNVFTSVFEPRLESDADPTELASELPTHVVGVFPSETGDSLLLTIPSIASAQQQVNVFTITSEGKVYRSTVIHVV